MIGISRRWGHAAAAVLSVLYLEPLAWIVITSLKSDDQIRGAPNALAFTPTLAVFREVLDAGGSAILTSLRIASATTLLVLVAGVPAAYALARIRMRGSGTMVLALLVAQLPPAIVLAAPLFILERRAGLTDTYLGLIAADTTLTLPFTVIVLRPVMRSVSPELEEAALVDGCGLPGVLLRVVLPLMVPGVVAAAGLSFLIGWGEFLFGLTLAEGPGVQPVTVLLNAFIGQHGTSWGALMATATLISIPVVCVFAVFQRFIVGGLTAGSVRG